MDSFAPPRVEFSIPLLWTSLSNTTLPKSHGNLPLNPRILGRCILIIGEPVITTLTQSCGVSVVKKKKEQKTKQKHYARVFSCDEYLTLFDPQKVGKKAQPMSFISSSSLCYTYRKKTFYTWAFTLILGWGIYQGFDLGWKGLTQTEFLVNK